MSIQFPTELEVICDGCSDEVEVDATTYPGSGQLENSVGVEDEDIEEKGWLVDGSQHYCPKCRKEYE